MNGLLSSRRKARFFQFMFQQEDRPRGRFHKVRLHVADMTIILYFFQITEHDSERFRFSALDLPQFPDSIIVERVGDEIVSADAFESDDPAVCQDLSGLIQKFSVLCGSVAQRSRRVFDRTQPFQIWPAGVTGDRLGVMPAVMQILILDLTEPAHREIDHGRVVPVIRDAVDDRIAGAAEHTADEGMEMTRVIFCVKLFEAVRTDRHVGRDHSGVIAAFRTAFDLEIREFRQRLRCAFDMYDLCRLGLLLLQCLYERIDPLRCISERDLDQTADVQYVPFHMHLISQFGNKGPESDSLYDAP